MFIRSKDGKHLTKVKTVDLAGNHIFVNGMVFGEYDSEDEAKAAFHSLCQECCDMETFFDLKGEIVEEEEDWEE